MLPDPRDRRGRRHTLASVLAVIVAAVAAGARSVTAIAEWATDAPWPILAALGCAVTRSPAAAGSPARPPSAGCWHGWAATRWMPPSARGWPTGCARCGTAACSRWTARGCGARPTTATRWTCWPRWTTTTAPCSPNGKSTVPGEVPTFAPLLAGLDTADAPHPTRPRRLPGRSRRRLPAGRQGQPAGSACSAGGLPWRQMPVMDRVRDHGHGRVEIRTLKVAAVTGLCFPHAAQAIQVIRRVRAPGSRRWRTVTVYAVTSLALGSASPACTGSATWDFGEDASTARSGSLPPDDGQPAQPPRWRVAPGRPSQPRRRAATCRPRPHPGRLPSWAWHTDETGITAHHDGAPGPSHSPPRLSQLCWIQGPLRQRRRESSGRSSELPLRSTRFPPPCRQDIAPSTGSLPGVRTVSNGDVVPGTPKAPAGGKGATPCIPTREGCG
jgi:DDE_Tnp_1-associated